VPFQCSIRALVLSLPTAQALLAEVAVTALRMPFTTGLRASRHDLPFQCSITVWKLTVKSVSVPTAHAFFEDVAAAPIRMAPPGTGFGLETRRQARPFQRSMTVLLVPISCPASGSHANRE
jgi:hypothetical protein